MIGGDRFLFFSSSLQRFGKFKFVISEGRTFQASEQLRKLPSNREEERSDQ